MKISISKEKEARVEAAYDVCVQTLAARRQATGKWWDAKSPWARFRAHCKVIARLSEVEEAQRGLSEAWMS